MSGVSIVDLLAGIQAVRAILDLVQRGADGSISEEEYKERMAGHEKAIQATEDSWKARHP
jgi:hypothetical protein